PNVPRAEMDRSPIGEDERAARMGIGRAVSPAKAVVHEFPPVLELEGEPVPSGDVSIERARAPLAIHPAPATHGEALTGDGHRATRRESRQRVVIGCVARCGALLRETAITLQDNGFSLLER